MPIDLLFFLLIGAVAVGAAVAVLHWDDIRSWLYGHRSRYSDYGLIVREALRNGNVRVVAGVFSGSGYKRASRCWDAESLDAELQSRFRGRSKVRISL